MKVEVLDAYVRAVLVGWLGRDDVADVIQAAADSDDEQAARAAVEVDRLKAELGEWRSRAAAGRITPDMAEAAESGLLARIAVAEEITRAATIPAALRDLVGKDAAGKWDAMTDVAARRAALKAALRVLRIHPNGRGVQRPLPERIEIESIFTPAA